MPWDVRLCGGRSATRTRGPKDDSVYVPQLRIYPHALREANAYYSPEKVALLFGYFNANDDNTGEQLPGGMVFTCLSQDIVAHETTHALLDGMHRKFVNATNPDVLAFHEGIRRRSRPVAALHLSRNPE